MYFHTPAALSCPALPCSPDLFQTSGGRCGGESERDGGEKGERERERERGVGIRKRLAAAATWVKTLESGDRREKVCIGPFLD